MDAAQKCLIYCRVSDTKQKTEGSGLQSQEHRCRQHAEQHGYIVERVFHDDISGGGDYAKRPGMTALLKFLQQNRKTSYVVVFDDLKRLARDTLFYWQLREAISDFGASVACPNYRFDDSPEGKFMETLFAAQGELERRQIARQTRQKTQARLEAGFYAFIAPVGYRFVKDKLHSKVLVPDEPAASALREAMEGFASGRFQTKQEVRRFLESAPEFPKSASGKIGNTRVQKILTDPLYAGYVEYQPWGVTLRKGHHEGLISYETYCRNQERLKGRAYAPARKDLNQDFPLRGSVVCTCGNALTASHSRSHTGKRYAYYLCQNTRCSHYGKSIRKADLQGEFEALLQSLTPTQTLFKVAKRMFAIQWERRHTQINERKALLRSQLNDTEKKIQQTLDRIVEASSASVIKAFERRIDDLEHGKLLLEEQITNIGQPVRPRNEMSRTALRFLENPYKVWELGRYEDKRAVIKLAFTDRLIYDRDSGYRTPNLSLPFKVLEGFSMRKNQMVRPGGFEPPTS